MTKPLVPIIVPMLTPALAVLLAGCGYVQVTASHLDVFPTALDFQEPADFAQAHFVTVAEVPLRSSEEEEDAKIVAVLPKDTPVIPSSNRGGECACWRVRTPLGTGWLHTRYIAARNVTGD